MRWGFFKDDVEGQWGRGSGMENVGHVSFLLGQE